MKTTIAYFTMTISVILLTLSLSGISYSAIDSVGEINVKDDNNKIIIAGSQADLLLVVKIEKIDISQARKKEEEIDGFLVANGQKRTILV